MPRPTLPLAPLALAFALALAAPAPRAAEPPAEPAAAAEQQAEQQEVVLLGGLPRRALLGAAFSPAAPESLAAWEEFSGGLVVSQVTGEGSLDPADWRDGDVIVGMGGELVPDFPALGAVLAEHRAGETLAVRRLRDGELQTVQVALRARPLAGLDGLRVEYGSVQAEGAARRSFLALPPGDGPHPAVLIIQGVGCFSLENGLGESVYGGLAQALGDAGFATLRVEKSGMGDSRGTPCAEIDFGTEVAGYAAGLAALKADPRVDPQRVYLFGHSMGGIIGPMIAAEDPVAGIAVFGTGVGNWIAYELNNLVDQSLMAGTPPEQLDTWMRLRLKASYELLALKRTPEEILADDPQLAPLLQSYPMNVRYFQELYDVDKFGTWKRAAAPTLVMWGTSDFVAKRRAHRVLADSLEFWRPGSVTHLELEGVDHHIAEAPTMLDAMRLMQQPQPRGLAPSAVAALVEWLQAQEAAREQG